jgi:hypothetical protein
MSEYITRERALEILNDIGGCGAEPGSYTAGWDEAINAAYEAIQSEPAADVAPVVHAHWINEPPYRALNGDFSKTQECSRCHRTYVSAGNAQYSNHKFCAECGAKMDGPVEWLKL